jgi:hypothetical protein
MALPLGPRFGKNRDDLGAASGRQVSWTHAGPGPRGVEDQGRAIGEDAGQGRPKAMFEE